jgi:hypothetical protein
MYSTNVEYASAVLWKKEKTALWGGTQGVGFGRSRGRDLMEKGGGVDSRCVV